MQPQTQVSDSDERAELREKIWGIAQRVTVLLVAAFVGLFIGYQLWGSAGQLKEQVSRLEEKVTEREKERDTLKSQMAIVDRDKKEIEKKFTDLQARCAAAAAPGTN